MAFPIGRDTSKFRRAKRCRAAGPRAGARIHGRRRGEAHRRQGWVGGVYPSAQIQGADSGFRRSNGFHPRRAKRRAQVCGEVTVISDGQGNQQSPAPGLAPHPPLTRSPFPSRGRLKRGRKGSKIPHVERLTPLSTLHSPLFTLHSSLSTLHSAATRQLLHSLIVNDLFTITPNFCQYRL